MSDAFQRGIERAFALRKKRQQSCHVGIAPVKVVQAKPTAKALARFDEELYQATIISKMIKLIHKIQGVN